MQSSVSVQGLVVDALMYKNIQSIYVKGFVFTGAGNLVAAEAQGRCDPEIQQLIRTMSPENIGGVHRFRAPRIQGELSMLGLGVLQATAAKYMIRHRKHPSHIWRTYS